MLINQTRLIQSAFRQLLKQETKNLEISTEEGFPTGRQTSMHESLDCKLFVTSIAFT